MIVVHLNKTIRIFWDNFQFQGWKKPETYFFVLWKSMITGFQPSSKYSLVQQNKEALKSLETCLGEQKVSTF